MTNIFAYPRVCIRVWAQNGLRMLQIWFLVVCSVVVMMLRFSAF